MFYKGCIISGVMLKESPDEALAPAPPDLDPTITKFAQIPSIEDNPLFGEGVSIEDITGCPGHAYLNSPDYVILHVVAPLAFFEGLPEDEVLWYEEA